MPPGRKRKRTRKVTRRAKAPAQRKTLPRKPLPRKSLKKKRPTAAQLRARAKRKASIPRQQTGRVLPSQRSLILEDRTVYRKGGKVVPPGTKGSKRVKLVVQLDQQRKVLRSIEKETAHRIIKLVVPSKLGFFEEEGGTRQGLIEDALLHSSITRDLHKARKVEVMMRWEDQRGKVTRRKLTLLMDFVEKISKFPYALVGLILETMRDLGVRTNYTVALFKKARQAGLKHPITWAEWNQLEIANNLELVVTLFV